MKKTKLTAIVRTAQKKTEAKALRREGKIPAVIYGGKDQVPVALDAREFHRTFHGTVAENVIVDLSLEGKETRQVLIKDYQYDPIRGQYIHLDFMEINPEKKLKTHVPIHLEGTPEGVKKGGLLEFFVQELEVTCLPKDLPEAIVLDISSLEVGDSLHVQDIQAPDGVEILNPPDQTVVAVGHAVSEVVVETPEAVEEEGGAAVSEESED
ncbi:50S ribosomal protein L25 [Spirochaeta thermophila DSM 6578]|uniref:Large ribosomal subunit protein bL25 n=1 Tax=Winmispira thermophila (strain ATCC 700085 / DSM 6578 / Z-1203) TaxID=869211 RepID=G0GDJ2_WINT7|nr:50S ribosomal protein L25 [Spirochaeta thermophila]AEJ61339.1 50S ribosomal protein L25 [Spirochaeta thermophila DSM 6578]